MVKSRRMRWVGHVARMGERRDLYRVLVEKPERRPPCPRWKNNGFSGSGIWGYGLDRTGSG